MDTDTIEKLAAKSISGAVTLDRRGLNDYRVNLPFTFADGDNLKVILKQEANGKWLLTDEAHTFMYLSYHDMEIEESELKQRLFENILQSHNMTEQNGRLVMPDIAIEDIGAAIFTFSQALLKVGDFSMWRSEGIKNLFMENFRQILPECIGGRGYSFNYHYQKFDPDGIYPIDCLILGKRNSVHVYAVNSDSKAKDAIISMRYYDGTSLMIPSCVIFDPAANIRKKSRIQVSDAADKTISSLEGAPENLPRFLDKVDKAA